MCIIEIAGHMQLRKTVNIFRLFFAAQLLLLSAVRLSVFVLSTIYKENKYRTVKSERP